MVSSKTLLQIIEQRNWTQLENTLDGMSNSEYRRTEQTIRLNVLPHLDNSAMWECLLHLITYRPQSFATGVTASEHLIKNGTLDLRCPEAIKLASWLRENSPAHATKIADMILPMLRSEDDIWTLFSVFGPQEERKQLALLLKLNSTIAYHAIFTILKKVEDDKTLTRRCALYIIRYNSDVARNMGSLLKAYFDLPDMPPSCSLKIEPYELSRIDRSFEDFEHVILGKRPQVHI